MSRSLSPPRAKRPGYPLNTRLGWPQSWSRRLKEISCPAPHPRHQTDCNTDLSPVAFVQQDGEAWRLKSSPGFAYSSSSSRDTAVVAGSAVPRHFRKCLIESSHIVHTLSTPSVHSTTVITRVIALNSSTRLQTKDHYILIGMKLTYNLTLSRASHLCILNPSHMVTPLNPLWSHCLLFTTVHNIKNLTIIRVCPYISFRIYWSVRRNLTFTPLWNILWTLP
jgi:hypothetical protein